MATVKEIREILKPFSDAKVTKGRDIRENIHVKGFVTCIDLKILVKRYKVFLHSNGALCVE